MPEPLDPEKFHVLTPLKKKYLLFFIIIFIVVIVPALGYWYFNFAVARPSQLDKETTFEIKKGESVSEIALDLYRKNAINSDFLFNLYVIANGYDKNIQAGEYSIQPGSSIKELAQLFQHGITDRRITFLEGWRVEEYAREAVRNFPNIDYVDFVSKAKVYEGMLYPDTYYFREDVEEDEIIQRLKQTFDEKTLELLNDESVSKTGLNKEQVLVFASILEREISNPDDRPVVAGILIKRWKEGMKIDADATTQYAVADAKLCSNASQNTCVVKPEEINKFDWWDQELTVDDLECDSQFNTRKYVGLPPAPISSTSVSAITAVINSKDSPYYYYLSDKQGVTRFARTLEEHNQNVSTYLGY